MKLPLLDQQVPLARGEAFTAGWAIGRYLAEATTRDQYQQRLYWQEALALAPLDQLRRRLLRRHEAEQRIPVRPRFQPRPRCNPSRSLRHSLRPKPRLLRVPYTELVALRACQAHIQALFAGHAELVTVLGKFHQQSTNLEQYIRFFG